MELTKNERITLIACIDVTLAKTYVHDYLKKRLLVLQKKLEEG